MIMLICCLTPCGATAKSILCSAWLVMSLLFIVEKDLRADLSLSLSLLLCHFIHYIDFPPFNFSVEFVLL